MRQLTALAAVTIVVASGCGSSAAGEYIGSIDDPDLSGYRVAFAVDGGRIEAFTSNGTGGERWFEGDLEGSRFELEAVSGIHASGVDSGAVGSPSDGDGVVIEGEVAGDRIDGTIAFPAIDEGPFEFTAARAGGVDGRYELELSGAPAKGLEVSGHSAGGATLAGTIGPIPRGGGPATLLAQVDGDGGTTELEDETFGLGPGTWTVILADGEVTGAKHAGTGPADGFDQAWMTGSPF